MLSLLRGDATAKENFSCWPAKTTSRLRDLESPWEGASETPSHETVFVAWPGKHFAWIAPVSPWDGTSLWFPDNPPCRIAWRRSGSSCFTPQKESQLIGVRRQSPDSPAVREGRPEPGDSPEAANEHFELPLTHLRVGRPPLSGAYLTVATAHMPLHPDMLSVHGG